MFKLLLLRFLPLFVDYEAPRSNLFANFSALSPSHFPSTLVS